MFTTGTRVTLVATDSSVEFPIGGMYTYQGDHPDRSIAHSYCFLTNDRGVGRYFEKRYVKLAVTMKDADALVDTIDKAIKKVKNL